MKRTKIYRALILSLVLILCITSFTGCGEALTEAKDIVSEFCEAVERGDVTAAHSKMHPITEMTEEELVASIENIEDTLGVSFADGVTVVACTDKDIEYSIRFPDGIVGEVELEFDIIIGGMPLELDVIVLEYDGAVGIYSFLLSVPDGDDSKPPVDADKDGVNKL